MREQRAHFLLYCNDFTKISTTAKGHVHVELGMEHACLQEGKVLAFGNPVSPTGAATRQK